MTKIEHLAETITHLRVALLQVLPSDDQIIVGHLRDALRHAEVATKAPVNESQPVESILSKMWFEGNET